MVSQEVFDETILENEQVFDLAPDEAVQETIDQLSKQTDTNNVGSKSPASSSLYHLLWSHPLSPQGKLDRSKRHEFLQLLENLKSHQEYLTQALQLDASNDRKTTAPTAEENNVPPLLQSHFERFLRILPCVQTPSSDGLSTNESLWRDWLGYLTLFQVHQGWEMLAFLWLNQRPEDTNIQDEHFSPIHDERRFVAGDVAILVLQTMWRFIQPPPPLPVATCAPISITTDNSLANKKILFAIQNIQQSMIVQWWSSSSTASSKTAPRFCQHWLRWYDHVFSNCASGSEERASSLADETDGGGFCKSGASLVLELLLKIGYTTCLSKRPQILRTWMQQTLSGGSTDRFVATCSTTEASTTRMLALSQLLPATLVRAATNLRAHNDTATVAAWEHVSLVCEWIIILCQYHPPPADADESEHFASCAHDHVLQFTKPRQAPFDSSPPHAITSVSPSVGAGKQSNESPHLFYVLLDLARLALDQLESARQNAGTTKSSSSTLMLDEASSGLSFCLTTLRVLAIQDDLVQLMITAQVLPVVRRAMTVFLAAATPSDDATAGATISPNHEDGEQTEKSINGLSSNRIQSILVACLGLLRNLCANDDMKSMLMSSTDSTSSWVSLLGQIMLRFPRQAKIQEHGCGLLAAMALRKPEHAVTLIEQYGCHQWLLAAMQHHPKSTVVLRQACLAIRNLASRGSQASSSTSSSTSTSATKPLHSSMLFDTGLEDVIIQHAVVVCPEEAYAALRDLGCSSADRYRPRQVQMFGNFKA